ncbi:hypothetical protein [Paracoccus seriniphilus]|uniref:hypothetical protein n=1 Tax=Paracoccus seriniphilus TaxID=184748 RepID=UPI00117C8C67|nr:hypothetical protein [Paracoccus seriniphilus]
MVQAADNQRLLFDRGPVFFGQQFARWHGGTAHVDAADDIYGIPVCAAHQHGRLLVGAAASVQGDRRGAAKPDRAGMAIRGTGGLPGQDGAMASPADQVSAERIPLKRFGLTRQIWTSPSDERKPFTA